MFQIGDKVRIKQGAAFHEYTGDAVGEVSAHYVEGEDYRSYSRPVGTAVYSVQFPFKVFIGENHSISFEDELEPVSAEEK